MILCIPLPVNGDSAGQGEGDGVAWCAIATDPVGGRRPCHIAAVHQQAAGRVGYAVLVHGGGHRSGATTH